MLASDFFSSSCCHGTKALYLQWSEYVYSVYVYTHHMKHCAFNVCIYHKLIQQAYFVGEKLFPNTLLVYELVQESIFSFQFFMAFDWECITTMEGTIATMVLQDSKYCVNSCFARKVNSIYSIFWIYSRDGGVNLLVARRPFSTVFWWRIYVIGLGSWIFSPGFFKVLDLLETKTYSPNGGLISWFTLIYHATIRKTKHLQQLQEDQKVGTRAVKGFVSIFKR